MNLALVAAQVNAIDPVAFNLGLIKVHWYGIILGTAALIALWLSIREGRKHGIVADTFLDLTMFAVLAGIVGARLYFVIFQWDYFSQHPGEIIAIWKGGIAIHGAIIGGLITVILFARAKKLSFWKLADIIIPHVLLAQAIGRWGNFMNQEAHGGVVSLEFLESLHLPQFIINQMYIYNPNPGGALVADYYYHHPTFLYESIWNLVGFIILISIRRLNLRQGEVFFGYFIWYSVGRFFIEGMRTDSLMLTETLRIAQVISIVLFVVAIIAIVYRRKRGVSAKRYLDE